MSDEPKRDSGVGKFCFGLILAAAFFLLTVCLVSHSAYDPSGGMFFTGQANAETRNLCGRAGAAVSSFLFDFCGVGVWFLLLAILLRLIAYFRSVPCRAPILKTIGFFLMLAAVTGTVSFVVPQWEVGTVYGPGGWYGAMVRTFLGEWFAPLGSAAFLMSLFLAGVVLACDWNFLRVLFVITGVYALSELITSPLKRKKAPKNPTAPADRTKNKPLPDALKRRLAGEETEPVIYSTFKTAAPAAEPDETDSVADLDEEPQADDEEYESDAQIDSDDERFESASVQPYVPPNIDLLDESQPCDYDIVERKVRETAERLEKAFADYSFNVRVVEMQTGPVLTLYEIALAKGVRLSKIRSLSADLEIAMKVPSVRIVAPIPGKNTVGVEIPNTDRQLVRLREVMEDAGADSAKMTIPIFLGKDVTGDSLVADLAKLPHLLIAGRTGTGKSVCLNAIILSILMTRTPDEVRLLLIDPKMVELSPYKTVPHLIYPVVTDMKKAEAILGWAVNKMEERYALLARAGARQLSEYNRWSDAQLRARMQPESDEEWEKIPKKIPYLVIVADEMADLMMVAGKDVEMHIIRLAQKSRAVGIHLVLATQKPTVDVITGLIKSNLPARIAFGVASLTDSRVVLDCKGAEQLLGNGDMLFLKPGTSQVIRGQGTFVSIDEMESVIAEISTNRPDFENELFLLGNEDERPDRMAELLRNKDPLYNEMVEYIIAEGRGSTSLLQRRFNVGYGRAARVIDTMAAEGIVGPYNGSQAREVTMTLDRWQELCDGSAAPEIPAPPERSERSESPRKTRFTSEKRVPFESEEPESPEEYDEEYAEEMDEEPEEEFVEESEEESEEEFVEDAAEESDDEPDGGISQTLDDSDDTEIPFTDDEPFDDTPFDDEPFDDEPFDDTPAEEIIEEWTEPEQIPNLRDLAKQRHAKKKNKKKKKKKKR